MTSQNQLEEEQAWRLLTALSLRRSGLLTGIVCPQGAKAKATPATVARLTIRCPKYATDLTDAAESRRFNSIDERTKDTERAIEILAGIIDILW